MIWILALMALIHPEAPRTGSARSFAKSIEIIVNRAGPIPGLSVEETTAALAVTLWEEGRYCTGDCPRGDGGRAVCSGQVWARGEAAKKRLETDPVACTSAAYWVMREGARICPSHPLAPYAGGCSSKAAQAIGDRRLAWARAHSALRVE